MVSWFEICSLRSQSLRSVPERSVTDSVPESVNENAFLAVFQLNWEHFSMSSDRATVENATAIL